MFLSDDSSLPSPADCWTSSLAAEGVEARGATKAAGWPETMGAELTGLVGPTRSVRALT